MRFSLNSNGAKSASRRHQYTTANDKEQCWDLLFQQATTGGIAASGHRAVVNQVEIWYNAQRFSRAKTDLKDGPQKESPVIQRRTQTETYWREQFELTSEDAGRLYDFVLDTGKPVSTATLAQFLIDQRCRQEERIIEAELSKGFVYQPAETYESGQQIIFPALDYALGTVVGTRPGRNPDYGDFTVIQVEFEDDDVREFASELHGEHKLNRGDGDENLLGVQDLRPAHDLYASYGVSMEPKLVRFLHTHDEFVEFGDEWFLRGLLAEIGPGRLNIAEALIDVHAMPLPTSDIVAELDLPAEVPESIRLLSLSVALDEDERFDNVGDSGRDIWYLRRLTPKAVAHPLERLVIERESYDRRQISQELLLIEREIDDEGSGEEVMGPSRPIYRTTISLIYPHWRAGTLPLTVRTRGLFPQASTHHSPIVLVDGQSGDKMQGWVVHGSSFVYGLKEWYERHSLPVGTFIKLERTRDPRVITVDFEARRLKRLWVMVAMVKDGSLTFQLRKQPILCEYDENLCIGEERPGSLDDQWSKVHARGDSLFHIMVGMMPELIKLSPQGTVHAKAIYSAVNVLKRIPPGPVFALLSTEPCFVAMGGGYWTFDQALVRR
jgi:hypothetical protein